MAFWGEAIKPGQQKKVEVPQDEVLHLSQICLNEPKPGKNYLQVQTKGATYTFACLEKDKTEHNALDLFFDEESTFINKGTSEIHLSGYREPKNDDDDEEEGESEEEEEESEEEDPKAAAKSSPKAAAKSPAAKAAASPKAEAAPSPKAAAKASPKASPKAAPKDAPKDDDDDDDDIDEMEEGEEEEMESDEEEEEEGDEPVEAPPAKKAKTEASPKAKAAASPKAAPAAAPAAGSDATKQYIDDLVNFLKSNGQVKLDALGSKVKRPQGVPKMKAVITGNSDKFVLEGDKVSLKK
mmetsp:Transcript_37871/g.57113  ORF Transcript_37871/g.57113 Transcript_37871/m.57113 type:complete len:296 (-) Transcript_37871:496-1383(-)|eukprot:CAMPEP_0194746784 /NCGR_PEP_ID=MMETSP0323_2-20130528/790_1 /TAXON_ID=2866 ORGANISM="Crypthecodinium cohnii, Strain Seligo" /NCGR_SAMPLE_ID=MMETSP0323_2 /ASSEMBLY_ACC=CAM_ASM_000346 /LENGTH=295 /DNA_ID=CAMNT_0039659547 /DNA_START=47 /DNA_END=934 /DNA_ORIENTATION=-